MQWPRSRHRIVYASQKVRSYCIEQKYLDLQSIALKFIVYEMFIAFRDVHNETKLRQKVSVHV